MEEQELWEKILNQLKNEISAAAFKTWFAKTKLLEKGRDRFEIVCPSAFARTKIESVYKERLLTIFNSIGMGGTDIDVTVSKVVETRSAEAGFEEPLFRPLEQKERGRLPAQNRHQSMANISPHYTLDGFVIGSNNRLAYAMASAVTKSPGANTNNPFFLYAAVGLGKTHLVQAVGNEVIRSFPSLRLLYSTSENFTNELIEAIQHRTQGSFRRKFRDVDVLIIDDIQFMAGRESTQEEFFNTFNSLYLSQKQIIITSDRHPKEITRLEERLTSRFGGGIMADIQNPDFETRLAILQTKAQSLNLKIDAAILSLVATSIQSNIRELEGGLKQVVNLMLSQNGEISISEVKNIFQDRRYATQNRPLQPQKIIKAVCDYFGLKETDLTGKRRTRLLVRPRQMTMYILRNTCGLPLMRIGELLGGKDHTTVMHGVKRVEREIEANPQIKQELSQLRRHYEEEL